MIWLNHSRTWNLMKPQVGSTLRTVRHPSVLCRLLTNSSQFAHQKMWQHGESGARISGYSWHSKQFFVPYKTLRNRRLCVIFYCVFSIMIHTVYPKKYAHGFVVLCFVLVMQSFIINSHEVFIHIHQGCFAGTGAIVRLPQCQWSKPDGYGKISQCITTTKHSKAKTVCIFLGIYCMSHKNLFLRKNSPVNTTLWMQDEMFIETKITQLKLTFTLFDRLNTSRLGR